MTTNHKETFDRFSLYFLAILISPILFGVLLATYSIIAFQESESFGPTVFVVALYSFPFFAFGAFPVSLYLDFSARTKNFANWVKVLLYAGFGGLAGLIGSVVLHDIFPIIFMFIFGMIGGVIHFSVLALINRLIK
ncbi:hypothetical protein [Sporosarcina jiandibaonis]|uniref:hypothetical protein n=1 Tax=Sporosarcina jiandibaonis TaxID=2715535 RepID=UPI0015580E6B|nr:hypothetical protein [Sporosarcina jiandibaonis]